MTQQTAKPTASGIKDWLTRTAIGFAALVLLGIASMLVITYRQDSRTADYVNSHPWTRECREILSASAGPWIRYRIIADHCRYTARNGGEGGVSRHFGNIIAVIANKDPASQQQIEPYLYRDKPIACCGRWRCAAPKS